MAEDAPLQANPNYFLDSASGAFSKGKTLSSLDDVARILDGAAQDGPANGLVLHFHGGLNARDYALNDIVPRLSKLYLSANSYPLFFVWESGLKETLINNKDELLKDPTFRELVKKVTEWTIRKTSINQTVVVRGDDGLPIKSLDKFREQYDEYFDGKRDDPPVPDAHKASSQIPPVTRNASPNPDDLELEITKELEAGFDTKFNQAIGEAFNASIPAGEVATKGVESGTTERADRVLLDESALAEMFPPPSKDTKTKGIFTWIGVARYVTKIVLAVIKRFRDHRDHGVYCTVVEEVLRSAFLDLLGTNIWNQMKNDTLDSFRAGADYCGTAVIAKLQDLQNKGKGFEKLTLIGHSTGAIYICNFLDAAKKAGLSFSDTQVVFLAPAVTCSRFATAVNAHGGDYLRNFRMFAMHDERESDDLLVPILYTRSLLYFVSGLLEGRTRDEGGWQGILDMPLVGMERFFDVANQKTFTDDPDVQVVLDFLQVVPHRTVWSTSLEAGDGLNSDSRKHGDFDNDEATLTSVVRLISR